MDDTLEQYEVTVTNISKTETTNNGIVTVSVNVNEVITEVTSPQDEKDLICSPLKTFEEVISWPETTPHPGWAKKVRKLQPKSAVCASGKDAVSRVRLTEFLPLQRLFPQGRPKTLFCHDYKGGYGEDQFVEGSDKYSEYRFFHWAGIDTFVYFSHYLVTIPPLSWINAAHLHGVKVLGTLITEWEDGFAIWKKILQSDDTIERFAEGLAAISQYFGFEGFLLNVENTLEESDVRKLELFIIILREKLVRLVPNSEVIWYDSVTVKGHLKWQNQLNKLNKPFFDVCDGIFLNYGWSEQDLVTSIENAGYRTLDVYVGVDVFGRGVYGGGGFNTDVAMDVIRKCGLSAALFAPGWVHETQPVAHFTSLEYLFWQKVWPYLTVHGPCQLPFRTSFCQGYGLKKYKQGVGVDEPWYNLSLQACQPSTPSDLNETCLYLNMNESVAIPERLLSGCVQHYSEDAFEGGGCLKIQRPNEFIVNRKQTFYYQRLLVCCFACQEQLLLSCATKPLLGKETSFSLVLLLEESSGKYQKLVLSTIVGDNEDTSRGKTSVERLEPDTIISSLKRWNLKINPYGNNGWRQSFFFLTLPTESRIVELGVELSGSSQPTLLGDLHLLPLTQSAIPSAPNL